jgi:putative Holliday junction resolvase
MLKPSTPDVVAPIIALDLGQKRVGVAVSDALAISIRRLESIKRSSWKRLLEAAVEVERIAEKLARSLKKPVFLQDERLTSVEAQENLKREGLKQAQLLSLVDSESAAIILRDFLAGGQQRQVVDYSEKESN